MNENIRVEIKEVPIEDCYPNPWNPNQMPTRVEEATVESIAVYGMLDPLTVRPHPDEENKYQIIDGEHRQRACMNLNYKNIPVNVLYNLDDSQAKKLTIISNETRGYADKITLAGLLNELSKGLDFDDLIKGLPYYEDELKELLSMGELDWGDYDNAEPVDIILDGDNVIFNLSHPKDEADKFETELQEFISKYPSVNMKRL